MENVLRIGKRKVKRIFRTPNKRIVNFLICGTQKGGTSALDAYLREHPEICMAVRKEVHFFDNEAYFKDRQPKYEIYQESFRPNSEHKVIGEATPIYMYWQDAPRRIWNYNPDMKLIVMLRNPIERAYSHWNMECSRQNDQLSFWGAIQSERTRCRAALPLQDRTFSYVRRGFYTEQLRKLWDYFSPEQVMVLKTESLRSEPARVLAEVCKFLGVGQFENVAIKNVHSRPYESAIGNEEKISSICFRI